MKKFNIQTLGCPKNLVDSEQIKAMLEHNCLQYTNDPTMADVIIINTCGFINSAKEESINTILDFAEYKKAYNCQLLIVTGCLVQRYEQELRKEIPEVDYFFNLQNLHRIHNLLSRCKSLSNIPNFPKRSLLTPPHYSYLRISDGCENFCSYCAIPYIRGKLRSRKISDITEETKYLAEQGVKELIIIAQDTTNYGKDIYEKSQLVQLLNELEKIEGIKWIRLLYLHPAHITKQLINKIAESEKICHYFDIPIQHINNHILQKMNRKITREEVIAKIEYIRGRIPDAVLRTSLIIGFPGETEKEFQELLDFLKEYKIDKLGAFTYSREEGTLAYTMKEQIPEKVKQERLDRLMSIQREISETTLRRYIGRKLPVIIDERQTGDSEFSYLGRTKYDAPEIDGLVYVQAKDVKQGDIVLAEIIDTLEYDMLSQVSS